MLGRFDESRMAKCMPSQVQPWAVHSLTAFSTCSSVTSESSTTLYCNKLPVSPALRDPL